MTFRLSHKLCVKRTQTSIFSNAAKLVDLEEFVKLIAQSVQVFARIACLRAST